MTSKEKKKMLGHWKMAAHGYYKATYYEYRLLSFTEQMRFCTSLCKEYAPRTPTPDEFDMRFLDYMEAKLIKRNSHDMDYFGKELFYG